MMKPTAILVALVAGLAMASAAYAQELKFEAELSGAAERPTPVVTDGVGEAKFESDEASVAFELKWDDLTSPAFAAHIHCGGPEASGPVGVTLFAAAMDSEGEVQGTFTAPGPRQRVWLGRPGGRARGDVHRRRLRQRPHHATSWRRDPRTDSGGMRVADWVPLVPVRSAG
jgi:CHRD domain